MSYATPSDVASLNKARTLGQGNNPTLADVQFYLDLSAAEIDAVLVTKGYQTPVASTQTGAYALLRSVNATGGWAKMEAASPNSPNVDRAEAAYDAAREMLKISADTLDAPKNTDRARPRAPFLSSQPTGRTFDPTFGGQDRTTADPRNPYFSRQQRF